MAKGTEKEMVVVMEKATANTNCQILLQQKAAYAAFCLNSLS
jgi:hypothetical protein